MQIGEHWFLSGRAPRLHLSYDYEGKLTRTISCDCFERITDSRLRSDCTISIRIVTEASILSVVGRVIHKDHSAWCEFLRREWLPNPSRGLAHWHDADENVEENELAIVIGVGDASMEEFWNATKDSVRMGCMLKFDIEICEPEWAMVGRDREIQGPNLDAFQNGVPLAAALRSMSLVPETQVVGNA